VTTNPLVAPAPTASAYRHAWAEVDLDAVVSNAALLARISAPSLLCAVVKADAYGHGAAPVARAALFGGASCLAVALVEEGVSLREAGIEAPILLLSEAPTGAMREVVERGLTPTVYSLESVREVRDAVRESSTSRPGRFPVQVKVDTGMHRVGADPDAVEPVVRALCDAKELSFGGLWTHLAVADEPRDPFTDLQLDRFEQVRSALRAAGLPEPDQVHAANSAGAIAHRTSRYDLVRCGIALYGHLPAAGMARDLARASGGGALVPALSWRARVSFVREVGPGERSSYGLRYETTGRTDLAVVPVGYADGVPRLLFERGGAALVSGRRAPIAGTVTMDQLILDCGPDSGVRQGDEVVLVGSQGDCSITVEEWAERLATISYEILCRIGVRLPRVHVGGPPS